MNKREEAQEFLNKWCASAPMSFFNKIDSTLRGYGFVLDYLKRADGEVIAGDFARELNVSTARIAALLKKMEKSGLITRYHSAEDARRTVVEITPAGTALIDEMNEQILIRVERLLEKISKDDIDNFIRISDKIREISEQSE